MGLSLGAVAVVAWAGRSVRGEQAHLTGWVLIAAVFAVPGLALTWRAGSRVAPVDRPVWRLWFAGFCVSVVGAAALLALSGPATGAGPGRCGWAPWACASSASGRATR